MEYYAMATMKKGRKIKYFLTESNQMDHYLSLGLKIYASENGEDALIATPEEGYVVEKPLFPIMESTRRNDGE